MDEIRKHELMTLIAPVLRRHEWDDRAKACACGWSQRRAVPGGSERLNHPVHIAELITREIARVDAD